MLLLTTVKWVAVDTLGQRLAPDCAAWRRTCRALNPIMGIGPLLAVSLVAVYWLRRNSLESGAAPGETTDAGLAAGLAAAVVAAVRIASGF